MKRIPSRPLAVAALGIALATPAFAATGPFDLVFADRVNVTLCEGCVFTLVGRDFGLFVNRGADPVTMGDLAAATFTFASSRPELVLTPFLNTTNPIAPLQTDEAVGTVIAGDNDVLLTQVLPGETFRNTAPLQFIAFAVGRDVLPAYDGPVDFDLTMTLGSEVAQFRIHAEVGPAPYGQASVSFVSAARARSVPVATPTAMGSWGRLKKLYR